jgi:hypothetical protein
MWGFCGAPDPIPKSAAAAEGLTFLCTLAMRAEPDIDLGAWARAMNMVHMAGIAAEARTTGYGIPEVIAYTTPSSDIKKIHKVARLVGVDRNVAINRAIAACEELFERPTAWLAVVEIASAIDDERGLSGWQMVAIARRCGLRATFSKLPDRPGLIQK